MTPGSDNFAVINADDTAPPFRQLAEVFSIALKMHKIDAFHLARKSTHIFMRGLCLQEARRIRALLSRRAIASHVVSENYFTAAGPTLWLSNANCLPGGFEIDRQDGTKFPVDWKDIALLSYGRVRERTRRQQRVVDDDVGYMVGMQGMPIHARPLKKFRPETPREDVDDHDILDIFVGRLEANEFAAHFRLNARKFYFDYLGERKQQTSMQNFRVFLQDIEYCAPHVVMTQKTVQFLNRQPTGKPFEGYAAFEAYTFWSIAMSRVRKDGAFDEG